MTLQEQFTRLLEKEQEKEALLFLKGLNHEQKKTLVPHLRKLSKEYAGYVPFPSTGSSSYRQKASLVQGKMLRLAAFLCFNRTEYEKDAFGYLTDPETLRTVLSWYCPLWFSDYINKYGQDDYVPYYINYDWIMEMAEKGYIHPSKELIAKTLPQLLNAYQDNRWNYQPEMLLKREITLNEHIWYIFEVKSNIHLADRYHHYGNPAREETGWMHLLKKLSAEGKIDRQRLLKQAMLATTRNFNKLLSGWFAELFSQLGPTGAELLAMQGDLFVAFNSPHSKPVTTVLGYLKKLVDEAGFDTEGFLENAPLLLASKTRTIVSSTLMILEKVAKRHPELRMSVCEAACGAFIHSDDALQTRAAKLILQYGDLAALRDTLAQYGDSLLSATRNTLAAFLGERIVLGETLRLPEPAPPVARLCLERELPPIECFDQLLYLASQAFDNNESYHFDQLPAALIRFRHEITGKNIAKLEPAFQRAYRLLFNGRVSTMGCLDHMLAIFFVEFAVILINELPEDARSLRQLHEAYTRKDEENKSRWSHYTPCIGNLAGWTTYEKNTVYEPHKRLLLEALYKLQGQDRLPLLSTPTHAPGWIDPAVLIDRLGQYQSKGVVPGEMDFQVAISRCALEGKEEALRAARQQLTGEYFRLLQFLLSDLAAPAGPFTHEPAWVVASLTKHPNRVYEEFSHFSCRTLSRHYLTGQFPWHTIVEPCSYNRYDYATRQNVEERYTRKALRIEMDAPKRKSLGARLSEWLFPDQEQPPLLYELLPIQSSYLGVDPSDFRRLLFLTPTHPEPLLAQVIRTSLSYGDTCGETDKKALVAILQTLHEVWDYFGETAHLFIATCMLGSDKTVRAFAAEIWLDGITRGTINSELLGEIIGKHQRVEFAPVKRLTDLILDNMVRVSARHNQALENLLAALLLQLPERPMGNLKKLLEIYLEVLTLNDSSIAEQKITGRLTLWKAAPSLRKVITALEAREPAKLAA